MTQVETAIVVPSVRKKCIEEFLNQSGSKHFDGCAIYVVEDNPDKTFDVSQYPNVIHFSWKDIDSDLGKNKWIIPRKTDCIRSYGFYKAWQHGSKYIISLDDDCYPVPSEEKTNWVSSHIMNLTEIEREESAWVSTIEGLKPRGMPFEDTKKSCSPMISHGLWTENPDLDAITHIPLLNSPEYKDYQFVSQYIPHGYYYPMCGMNVAFKSEITPIMYFLLMGKDYEYDRFGDIWCGIFSKKILDHLSYDVWSGTPIVRHIKASDPWVNLEKEKPGYKVNEMLWEYIDKVPMAGHSYGECYVYLANLVRGLNSPYWDKLSDAMNIWKELFDA